MNLTRPLGLWETICRFGHDFFGGTGNVCSVARLNGFLQPDKLISLFEKLYHKHPLLRATIEIKNYESFFELNTEFNNIPITIVERSSKDEWQKVVEQEMGLKFIANQYLWRAVLLQDEKTQDHELIITYHHAIADGLSTAYLVQELLMMYADDNHTNILKIANIPCSVENALAQKNTWDNFLNAKHELKKDAIYAWPFSQFARLKERKTRNIYREITPDRLLKLQQICREKQTTINAALNAAMLLAALEIQADPQLSTSLHTPVNLRQYCDPPLDLTEFGCYIAMVTTNHLAIQNNLDFWELARSYQQQLQQNIQTIGHCPADFSLNSFTIEEIMALFEMPGSTKRDHYSGGFGVTNIGKLDFEAQYGNLKLNYFMFCTNRVMGDFVVFLNVVTLHKQMALCFSYVEPLLATQQAETFVECVMNILATQIAKHSTLQPA